MKLEIRGYKRLYKNVKNVINPLKLKESYITKVVNIYNKMEFLNELV